MPLTALTSYLTPPSGRPLIIARLMAAVMALSALLILLHSSGLVPLSWQTKPLEPSHIQPLKGHAWKVSLAADWMDDVRTPQPSPAVLLEDGRPLPLPAAAPRLIASHGAGRYAFMRKTLLFSASDNASVQEGAHRYALRWPTPISANIRTLVYALGAGSALLLLLWAPARFWRALRGRPGLLFGLGLIALAFAVTRLPFYIFHGLPRIAPDSFSYVTIAMSAEAGHWPQFFVRSPGYPLFLLVMHRFSDNLLPVLIAQSLLALAVFFLLFIAVRQVRPGLTLPAALMVAALAILPQPLLYETALLTESIYTSLLMAAMACLLPGLCLRSPYWLAGSSACMALTILVRPSALFLLVIYLLALLFLWRNRAGARAITGLFLPLAILLFASAGYNRATLGEFQITFAGGANLGTATAMYWETDPNDSPEVTHMVQQVLASFPPEVQQTLQTSWDLEALHRLFKKNYDYINYVAVNLPTHLSGPEQDQLLRRMAARAIRQHPELYAKFVLSMLREYFVINPKFIFQVYSREVPYRFLQLANRTYDNSTPPAKTAWALREFRGITTHKGVALIPLGEQMSMGTDYHPASKPHQLLDQLVQPLFATPLWAYLAAGVFLGALVVTLRRRLTDGPSCYLFLLCSAGIGAALLVCLTEEAHIRYAFPSYFIYPLAVLLFPLLWATPDPPD